MRAHACDAGLTGGRYGTCALDTMVAAATRFDGCPELGAIPSVLLRRRLATECGPWELVDRRLGLRDRPQAG